MNFSIIISCSFLICGLFFLMTAAVGAVRMPNFYSRIHALGVADSFGIPVTIIGLAAQEGFTLNTVKLLMLLLMMMIIAPVSSYILIKTVHENKIKLQSKNNDKLL